MLLATLMKTKLNGFTGDRPYGDFHTILSSSLEYWTSRLISMQFNMSIGTTVTGPTVVPDVYTVTSVASKIYFPVMSLKSAMLGEDALENLFDLIGTKITTDLALWESAMNVGGVKIPNVAGICPVTFSTGHFRAMGRACKLELSTFDPLMPELMFNTWLTIEKYLKKAINAIVPAVGVLTGLTKTGGIFTGQTTVKLIATL